MNPWRQSRVSALRMTKVETGVARTHRRHSAQDISPLARLSSMSSSLVTFLDVRRGSAGISAVLEGVCGPLNTEMVSVEREMTCPVRLRNPPAEVIDAEYDAGVSLESRLHTMITGHAGISTTSKKFMFTLTRMGSLKRIFPSLWIAVKFNDADAPLGHDGHGAADTKGKRTRVYAIKVTGNAFLNFKMLLPIAS